jgi:hypothetical protein
MKIDGTEYKAVIVEKMVVNGKEQNSSVILGELTNGVQHINVNVYTKSAVDIESKKCEEKASSHSEKR